MKDTKAVDSDKEAEFVASVNNSITDHFKQTSEGLLQEMALAHFSKPGKLLRPKMIFQLSQLFDLDLKLVVAWASCCEVLHNATLIHDDLQDGDLVRRNAPTIWSEYGAAQAINLGDYMLLAAPQFVLKSEMPSRVKAELLDIYSRMSIEIVNGQSAEMELNKVDSEIDLNFAYKKFVLAKTSALFSGLAEGVACLADVHRDEKSEFVELFAGLGEIFQVQDDIVDLWGNKKRNEMGCDIKEGKVSALVAGHLKHCPEDFSEIKRVLTKHREKTTTDDIERIKFMFVSKGTLSGTLENLSEKVGTLARRAKGLDLPYLDRLVCEMTNEILLPIQHLSSSLTSRHEFNLVTGP